MAVLAEIARSRLSLLEAQSLRRILVPTRREGKGKVVRGKEGLISFSCNDYLGLSHDPRVVAAAAKALREYGAGAGASRLVTGNYPLLDELENEIASMKGVEAACVFGSGYLANLGAVPAIVGKGDMVLADKFSHACMLDGAKLSGADVYRYAHNSVDHLRKMLEIHRSEYQNCLVLTETVFSMEGDTAPLAELREVCDEYECWLMTDDAHGLGIADPKFAKLSDIQMGTLSKAAGSYGGYIAGSADVIDLLKTTARSLIFSTALPPASAGAALEALRIIQSEPERGRKVRALAQHFCEAIGREEHASSAIVPVVIGEEEAALDASKMLAEEGYQVNAIRPPTVPPGTSRLRFAFSTEHTEEQIDDVVQILKNGGWV